MSLRLSVGSAVHLGLRKARVMVQPTTIYTMLGNACLGSCRFCTQSRTSKADRKFLSRVIWPAFGLDDVLSRLAVAEAVGRICIQTLKYATLLPDLLSTVESIKVTSNVPISVCMNPVNRQGLIDLKNAGAERVGVGLDCATQQTFERIKPGFSWVRYLQFVEDIVDVFGRGSVHLIVGLGDTDEAMIRMFQHLRDFNAYVALFAYTPVRGTHLAFAPPPVERYRALQVARHLMMQRKATFADMAFREEKLESIRASSSVLETILETGAPFRTSGCPDCNRPMYNERPGGVMYNYPQPLTEDEKSKAQLELEQYLHLDH